MAGVGLRIDVQDQVVKEGLRGIRLVGGDLRPVLHDAGAELESSTVRRFDTAIAPDGQPWKPSERARLTGGKTLVLSTRLKNSIHYQLDGATAVEVGSNVTYAAAHQGGVDKEVTVPAHTRTFTYVFGRKVAPGTATVGSFKRHMKLTARPYLGVSAQDAEALQAIVKEHKDRAVNAANAAWGM